MNTLSKEIKNNNGSIDKIFAKSNDKYNVIIGNNYKLIKFSSVKKSFRDSFLGTDIGIHSKGFSSVAVISTLVAVCLLGWLVLSFRI